MKHIPSLPTFPESLWYQTVDALPSFPNLQDNIEADVVVVGGGIAGITTAYQLTQAGLKVVLLEAGKLLNGTTGHTTAKVTAQHHLIYDELLQGSVEKAALYFKANENARKYIESLIQKHAIDCSLQAHDAYVYTNSEDQLHKLEKEMAAYETLGIKGALLDHIPLQIPVIAALKMDGQAQFNPIQYMAALINILSESGCQLYENTSAIDIEEGSEPKVVTVDGHTVSCKHVAICTHFPFYDNHGLYFARMYSERSYAIAIKSEIEYPGGMYISAEEPSRSIRSAMAADGKPLTIIGGQNHKTGQGICTIGHYEALQQYASQYFNASEISYRWSAQDLVTGDKIPYIGRSTASSTNIYIATGFKKWGMTNSTVAAILISDLIQGNKNDYEELFAPSRPMTITTMKNLVVENLDVAKHLIGGKIELVRRSPADLQPDEGSVVSVRGRRAGAYKDKDGKLYIVDTTCTHMGCEVEWNDGERSWDCPCHGSRFSITGEVMEGPALEPLKTVSLD